MSLMACYFSSERHPITQINFFLEHRNFGSLFYNENASSVSVKNLQDMEISNTVEIEASMQFKNKTLLRTWVHVVGIWSFLLRCTVAMSGLR